MDKKYLGIIGTLLYALSYLPHIGLYLMIFGFISLFFAVKDYEKAGKNLFIGFLINILGYGLYIFWGIGTIGALIAYLNNPQSDIALGSVIIGILGIIGGMYILTIISSYFYKNMFLILKEKTGIKYFEWAGYLIFFGSFATIFVIGVFIMIAGWIAGLIGFLVYKERKALPKPSPKESR